MCIYHPHDLNDEQQQTLKRIFKDPPLPNILWTNAIELLAALQGATISEMSNKICVKVPHSHYNYRVTVLSPVENNEYVDSHQVKNIRAFLIMLDIRTSGEV